MIFRNTQGVVALKKVIKEWQNDKTWVSNVPNYFVKKEVGSVHGPNGELMLIPQIVDTTWLPDGKLHIFVKSVEYDTNSLNNDMVDSEYDAKEFEKVLKELTDDLKAEIEETIKEWENAGKKILTSNPFLAVN